MGNKTLLAYKRWSVGVMEYWRFGVLEIWSVAVLEIP